MPAREWHVRSYVSMESGLEDRNNTDPFEPGVWRMCLVSMESGLEDRNNHPPTRLAVRSPTRLNGVRPRRPEQSAARRYLHPYMRESQWSPA